MRFACPPTVLTSGTLCRSKDAIITCSDEAAGRVCRVVAVVPESRWRSPAIPEYKVELLALPVSAYRRHDQLVPLMGETTSELAVAG